ncbi:DUF3108 domain-containing protein [Fusobacterium sp. PH5-44]|uniref:DUF3108 domain-containing protein n=1 Tax=unclassified Fusobacterium TaxID=2648384 RepID=UPI003D1E9EC6
MKRILCLLMVAVGAFVYGKNNFNYGEKAIYNAYWNGIKAGTAVMEVLPQNGNSTDFTFKMTMKTNAFADKFYSSRQTFISTVDNNLTQSKGYQQKGKEKKKERNRKLEFDWKKNQVKYYREGKLSKTLAISKGTLDPLSIFYFFRNQDLKVGQLINCTVTDGKKIIKGHAIVTREEIIKVGKFGKVKTFVVEPDLKGLGGIFSGSSDDKMEIWLTQGETKIPVKIKSKVKVGSFTAELDQLVGVKL